MVCTFICNFAGDALKKLEERGVVVRFVIGRRLLHTHLYWILNINFQCCTIFLCFILAIQLFSNLNYSY